MPRVFVCSKINTFVFHLEGGLEGYTPFRHRLFVANHFVAGTLRRKDSFSAAISARGHFTASHFVAGTFRRGGTSSTELGRG